MEQISALKEFISGNNKIEKIIGLFLCSSVGLGLALFFAYEFIKYTML